MSRNLAGWDRMGQDGIGYGMNSGGFVSETLEEPAESALGLGFGCRPSTEGGVGLCRGGGPRDAPSVSHLASPCSCHVLICQVAVLPSGWRANR